MESPPLFLGLPGSLASWLWRRPLLFNVADLWPDSAVEMGVLPAGPRLRFAVALERWIYRQARWVGAATDGIRIVLTTEKGVPNHKVVLLPNGVDTDLFNPGQREPGELPSVPAGAKIVLYAGTVGVAQGLGIALDAITIARRHHDAAWLVIMGDGPECKRLQARARAEGIAGVTFVPPQPLTEVARAYRAASAGLVTLRGRAGR